MAKRIEYDMVDRLAYREASRKIEPDSNRPVPC